MNIKQASCLALLVIIAAAYAWSPAQITRAAPLEADAPTPPTSPVKLLFIHHSTGGNWLADPNNDQPYGGLGLALRDNNYYVSATNYGWGPDGIGDRTDIPNWPEWFTGPNRDTVMAAVYSESGQNVGDFGAWSRMSADPGGENEIIMFKSCFPNSDLYGNPDDPPASEPNDEFSVSNAKAVYNNILTYFATRQDKLFIVITAPPLMQSETESDRAANARAFNNWLVNDWLRDYAYNNVAVFDYYNVLTGKDDANAPSGNHHRWWNGAVQHIQTINSNFSAYPSGDSHPSTAGHQKAAAEFVPLLNVFYHRWKEGAPAQLPPRPTPAPLLTATPAIESPPPTEAAPGAPPAPSTGIVDDFEADADRYTDGDNATITLTPDNATVHSGSASLRVNYDIAPGGWGGFGRTFEPSQDWSSGSKLALWLRSEKAGQTITLILFSGDPASPTPFEVHLEPSTDWKQFVFPLDTFTKPDWAGAEGLSALEPGRITGYGFSLGDADGNQNTGVLWVDDIGVVTGEAQPPPPPASQPTSTATPVEEYQATTEPAVTAAPTAPTGAAPSGGLCPLAMIVLALGLVFALLVHSR